MTKSFSKFHGRILVLSSMVILFWAGLTMRFFYVQILRGSELREYVKRQGENQIILPAVRGTIRDRNLSPLAQNVVHYSFAVHPQEVKDRQAITSAFSEATGRSRSYYEKRLNSESSFVYLERNLKKNISQPLLRIKDPGLVIHRHGYRSYPHHNIASQITGFTNVDNIGLEGIEKEFDTYLRGRDGWLILQTDGKGRSQKNPSYPREEPIDGCEVVLTIDLDYQAILQDELLHFMKLEEAKSALGILIEPHSGRILAMASFPDFNPNSPFNYPKENYKNHVITDQFEPGSTFKIIPATAALSKNSVTIDEEFNCEDGSYEFRGMVIKDWSDFGLLTFPQIIQHSSNVGIIKISERVGAKNIYLFSRKYGFGAISGISLPGETQGILRSTEEWSAISLAEISLGHEISISTLQLAFAYGAVANGGFLMKPLVVDKIVHPSGRIIFEQTPQIIRRIASKEVMDTLTEMLQRVVESGTGTSARIKGWTIAGKTGTAQKYITGGYSTSKFVSSFVGFLPANNPQILGVIVIDEPKKGYHWGGVGAAPVFKEIMKRIINTDDDFLVHHTTSGEKSSSREFTTKKRMGNPISMMMSTPSQTLHHRDGEKVKVPELRGKSLRNAVGILKKVGLKPTVQGSGTVVWQSPVPGVIVKINSTCTIGLN